ncbi:hypothetical protein D3C79_998900 [compost metagenome]
MGHRQVVAVLVRELRGARDQRKAGDAGGDGRGGNSGQAAQYAAAGDFGHGCLQFYFDAI